MNKGILFSRPTIYNSESVCVRELISNVMQVRRK